MNAKRLEQQLAQGRSARGLEVAHELKAVEAQRRLAGGPRVRVSLGRLSWASRERGITWPTTPRLGAEPVAFRGAGTLCYQPQDRRPRRVRRQASRNWARLERIAARGE